MCVPMILTWRWAGAVGSLDVVVAGAFQLGLWAMTLPSLYGTLAFLAAGTPAWPRASPSAAAAASGAAATATAAATAGSGVVSLTALAAWLLPAAGLVLVFATVPATRALMAVGLAGLTIRAVHLRRHQRASLRLL
jgi:hypothetical protein